MKLNEKVKNILVTSEGGLGKVISSTAVIRALKKQYPDKKIYVVSGFPEVFMYNPHVYRTYNFNNPLYLYDDLINEDTHVVSVEPYKDYDYINGNSHLIESWCKLLDIPCDGLNPDLFFIEQELDAASMRITELKKEYNASHKKVLLLQWIGGKIPEKPDPQYVKGALASMYIRHIPEPVINEIVQKIKDKYLILNFAHAHFPDIKDTVRCFHKLRETLALLSQGDSFIGIDSFVMHACASPQLNKSGIVCWAGTNPKKLGYDIHINLEKKVCSTPQCHRPNSYLFDIGQDGKPWSCPYGELCTKYTSEEILTELANYENSQQMVFEEAPIETTDNTKEPCTDNCHCNK